MNKPRIHPYMVATPSRRSISSYVGSLRPPSRRLAIYTLPVVRTHTYTLLIPPYLHTIGTPNPPICTRLNPPMRRTSEDIHKPSLVCPETIHTPSTCSTSYKYIPFIYKRQKRTQPNPFLSPPINPWEEDLLKSIYETKSSSIHPWEEETCRHKRERRHG